ncbi:retrotransposon protein, putative, ty1-copia subclass [Tanacetum coccineum]
MLHRLYMDLCGPMRVESINGKRYVQVIMDGYSRYTWVHFLISKDEAPEVIIKFLKQIQVLLQAPVIIVRTDNGTELMNHVLKAYFEDNDREDIGKLGTKDDISFFIGYSSTSYAYKVYNLRTKKVMKMMHVTFDELSAMAFEQRKSKPKLQGRTSRHISSGIDLTYASSTIILVKWYVVGDEIRCLAIGFSLMCNVKPHAYGLMLQTLNPQTPNASATTAETAMTPTNSSTEAPTIPNTSQDVDELQQQQQHFQQQNEQPQL